MNERLLVLESQLSYLFQVLLALQKYSLQQKSTVALLKSVTALLEVRHSTSSFDCNSSNYGITIVTDKKRKHKINYPQNDSKKLCLKASEMKSYQINQRLLILERKVSAFSTVLQTIQDYFLYEDKAISLQQSILMFIEQCYALRKTSSSYALTFISRDLEPYPATQISIVHYQENELALNCVVISSLVKWKGKPKTAYTKFYEDVPNNLRFKGGLTKNQWNKQIDRIYSWLVTIDIDPAFFRNLFVQCLFIT
jgi:hypothetical protein